jgi:hypothetical protein
MPDALLVLARGYERSEEVTDVHGGLDDGAGAPLP